MTMLPTPPTTNRSDRVILQARLPRDAAVLKACLGLTHDGRAHVLAALLESYLVCLDECGVKGERWGDPLSDSQAPVRYALTIHRATAEALTHYAKVAGKGHTAATVAGALLWHLWSPAVEYGALGMQRRLERLPLRAAA